MNYFHVTTENGKINVSGIATERRYMNATVEWISRWDFSGFDHVLEIAAAATAFSGNLYVAIDSGEWVSPRFDVIEAPKVGEAVSYAFNGDSYPDGHITHITPGTLRIIKTDTGSVYYRRRNTGNWRKKGGTWSMIHGHHNKRNPSF